MQSHTGILRIFPAIPSSWKDVSFKDLRAMGAFLVSAEKKDGRVKLINIYPEQGGICQIALPTSMLNREVSIEGNDGEVTRKDNILTIHTKKGEAIRIR